MAPGFAWMPVGRPGLGIASLILLQLWPQLERILVSAYLLCVSKYRSVHPSVHPSVHTAIDAWHWAKHGALPGAYGRHGPSPPGADLAKPLLCKEKGGVGGQPSTPLERDVDLLNTKGPHHAGGSPECRCQLSRLVPGCAISALQKCSSKAETFHLFLG